MTVVGKKRKKEEEEEKVEKSTALSPLPSSPVIKLAIFLLPTLLQKVLKGKSHDLPFVRFVGTLTPRVEREEVEEETEREDGFEGGRTFT